jgi:Tfp pilus assembly ATPase PilU
MKAHGKLVPMTDKALPQGYTRKIANQVMNEDQRKEFEEKLEMNLALMEDEEAPGGLSLSPKLDDE